MWWLSDFLARKFVDVLNCGQIPQHVAFIVDGNRRYARSRNEDPFYGHKAGSETLKTIARWCNFVGIKETTVYAFSIENFKRSKKEIEDLFGLIEELIIEVLKTMPYAEVRLAGNLELLPPKFKKSFAKHALLTSGDKKLIINVAIAYTARDDITNAIKLVNEGVRNGHLILEDIDEDLLSQCLYVPSEPDVLIRTSGELRFSDFLLWQIGSAQVNFVSTLWPNFNVWLFLWCVFKYQMNLKHVSFVNASQQGEGSTRKTSFITQLRNNRLRTLQQYANT